MMIFLVEITYQDKVKSSRTINLDEWRRVNKLYFIMNLYLKMYYFFFLFIGKFMSLNRNKFFLPT